MQFRLNRFYSSCMHNSVKLLLVRGGGYQDPPPSLWLHQWCAQVKASGPKWVARQTNRPLPSSSDGRPHKRASVCQIGFQPRCLVAPDVLFVCAFSRKDNRYIQNHSITVQIYKYTFWNTLKKRSNYVCYFALTAHLTIIYSIL